jgi:hypothetical protein
MVLAGGVTGVVLVRTNGDRVGSEVARSGVSGG